MCEEVKGICLYSRGFNWFGLVNGLDLLDGEGVLTFYACFWGDWRGQFGFLWPFFVSDP